MGSSQVLRCLLTDRKLEGMKAGGSHRILFCQVEEEFHLLVVCVVAWIDSIVINVPEVCLVVPSFSSQTSDHSL